MAKRSSRRKLPDDFTGTLKAQLNTPPPPKGKAKARKRKTPTVRPTITK